MSAIVANQPPRALYGAAMLAASAMGIACAFVVAALSGDDPRAARAAAIVIAGASLVGFAPAIIGTAERFGVSVLVASISRLLIVLVAGLMVTQFGDQIAKRPLWLGAVSGAVLILVVETAVSVAILAAIERRRHGAPLAMQEPHGSC